MRTHADVVIIGGGVIGTSIAYHLAKMGAEHVIVLEKESMLGMGSTGKCAGGIRQQFSTEVNIRLAMESVRFFEAFGEEVGADPEFRQYGYLFLATSEEDAAAFQHNVSLQRNLGLAVDVLSPQEVAELVPSLNVEDVLLATYCPSDGYADPHSVLQGLAKGARRLGVEICTETEATAIEVAANQVRAVGTNRGRIETSVVVDAAGPWLATVARMAGIELPVLPYRRQIFVTNPFPAIPDPLPMVIDFQPSFYFRKEGPGILMGMTDEQEPSSFNTHVDWDFLEQVVEKAIHRAPVLAQAGFMDGWGGLYAVTADDNAILGPLPEVEGFICAGGFSGHGFMQAPAVGRVLAEMILQGRSIPDISPLSIHRLREGREYREEQVI
jgi:sarcosine oxidase subunit beta